MALVAAHLEARGAGPAHRVVDPPLRLAGGRRRSRLFRPLRLRLGASARAFAARSAHGARRPGGGVGAEGTDLRPPGLPAGVEALREEAASVAGPPRPGRE